MKFYGVVLVAALTWIVLGCACVRDGNSLVAFRASVLHNQLEVFPQIDAERFLAAGPIDSRSVAILLDRSYAEPNEPNVSIATYTRSGDRWQRTELVDCRVDSVPNEWRWHPNGYFYGLDNGHVQVSLKGAVVRHESVVQAESLRRESEVVYAYAPNPSFERTARLVGDNWKLAREPIQMRLEILGLKGEVPYESVEIGPLMFGNAIDSSSNFSGQISWVEDALFLFAPGGTVWYCDLGSGSLQPRRVYSIGDEEDSDARMESWEWSCQDNRAAIAMTRSATYVVSEEHVDKYVTSAALEANNARPFTTPSGFGLLGPANGNSRWYEKGPRLLLINTSTGEQHEVPIQTLQTTARVMFVVAYPQSNKASNYDLSVFLSNGSVFYIQILQES